MIKNEKGTLEISGNILTNFFDMHRIMTGFIKHYGIDEFNACVSLAKEFPDMDANEKLNNGYVASNLRKFIKFEKDMEVEPEWEMRQRLA